MLAVSGRVAGVCRISAGEAVAKPGGVEVALAEVVACAGMCGAVMPQAPCGLRGDTGPARPSPPPQPCTYIHIQKHTRTHTHTHTRVTALQALLPSRVLPPARPHSPRGHGTWGRGRNGTRGRGQGPRLPWPCRTHPALTRDPASASRPRAHAPPPPIPFQRGPRVSPRRSPAPCSSASGPSPPRSP